MLKFSKQLIIFILALLPFGIQAQWAPKQSPLDTRWAASVDPENTLPEYPRPQMVRSEWLNLNGLWELEIGQANDNVPFGVTLDRQILVPFPVESALSGIMERHERLWYRRTFQVPESWSGKRVLMHFGAIDWESEVFINGQSMGIHRGGYDEISLDITNFLIDRQDQEVIVRVYDPTEAIGIPRGKQENPPHGLLIMYTPVTGIWQTVWLEPVEDLSIRNLKLIPDVDGKRLKVTVNKKGLAEDVSVTATAKDGDKIVGSVTGMAGAELYIPIEDAKLWSPDSPFLYNLDVEIKSGLVTTDAVTSYFGMRKVSIEEVGEFKKMFLNNTFCYNFGFLDQGYWPDGIYTAPTDEALKYDIQIQKDFGYNMVRKHLKVEPQRWYYWADKLGIMVWQDMPSANSYKHNPPPVEVQQYEKELSQMVDGLMNSPAVTTWVVFNETQGQKSGSGKNLTKQMVDLVKAKDPSRLINAASDNIYKDYIGDILDYHSYPGPRSIESETMATACGEFGSIGLAFGKHEWMPDSGVSMIMVDTPKELEDIYEGYIRMLAEYKWSSGMSGAVFTQLTDVEQEINGFLTYDRVSKVDIPRIKAINEGLIEKMMTGMETLLPVASENAQSWKYTTSSPSASWMTQDFNDGAWKMGKGGFGAGNPPNSITNTSWNTSDIWLRKDIQLTNVSANQLDDLMFYMYYDEDFDIYINGVLAASGKGYTSNYVTIPLNFAGKQALNLNGVNTIAVHCRQTSGGQYIDVGLRRPVFADDSSTDLNRESASIANKIAIYPNPAESVLNINKWQNLPENMAYVIYDSMGKRQLSGIVDRSQINVQALTKGVYHLLFQSNKFEELDLPRVVTFHKA